MFVEKKKENVDIIVSSKNILLHHFYLQPLDSTKCVAKNSLPAPFHQWRGWSSYALPPRLPPKKGSAFPLPTCLCLLKKDIIMLQNVCINLLWRIIIFWWNL